MTLADQTARDRIASDLDTTFVVEAAAGTGKTTALVGRIVTLLRTGRAQLSRIVAVTFTEKAAGEMKLRVRAGIDRARLDATDEERARLDQALSELETARISTIHSVCADLLRERPVEARIDPAFQVAAEAGADDLLEAAFEDWFEAALANPGPGVRRILRRDPYQDGQGPRDWLLAAARRLVDHRDFDAPWRLDPFDRDAAVVAWLTECDELVAYLPRSDNKSQDYNHLYQQIRLIRRWRQGIAARERATGMRDLDRVEAELTALQGGRYKWQWKYHKGRLWNRSEDISTDEVRSKRDRLKVHLDDLVSRCQADLAARLHAELQPVIPAYEQRKAASGRLDFLDLLQRTRDLLATDATVRAELQQRFTHLLVDEFQDNDPLQTDIVLLLAADDPAQHDPAQVCVVPGKLFLVGDPKQSIYRFRRADVRIYQRIATRLREQGAEILHLSTSFRSDPRIQAAVNAAFAPRMQGGSQAEYVALERHRAPVSARPAVIVLSVPAPFAHFGKVTKKAVDESLPDAVGAWIEWLVRDSGWTVATSDDEQPVPVAPRHICLLFRRFTAWHGSVTAPYTTALEVRDIPHVLVGGRGFHEREEVAAMRTALTAIEWPDDELSVFATLKGPLFAVGDDALLAWRHTRGALNPLSIPELEDDDTLATEVAGALDILRDLHLGRNRRPLADTITQLLDDTRAHGGLALWENGEQVLANVLRVAQEARSFESAGATSFRALVEHLAAAARRGNQTDASVLEEGTEGVRVMTVHKAKGLEFPVVILCDPNMNHTSAYPSRYVDPARHLWVESLARCTPPELAERAQQVLQEDAEEADRLLYVATTRARDLLVVPGVGDEPLEGWLSPLNQVIRPREPDQPRLAPGCPDFGRDSVLVRPGKASFNEHTARPGQHTPIAGEHTVTWWDPRTLRLGVRADTGLRTMGVLVPDPGEAAASVTAAHDAWAMRRTQRVWTAGAPSLEVVTPSDEDLDLGLELPPVPVVDTGADRHGRPTGKRFGILVHALLADAPLGADPDTLAHLAHLHGRDLMATPEEIAAAAQAAATALSHDLMKRAAASPDCRREVAVCFPLDDGRVVEGAADLAFREDDHWVVVDFKTDANLAAHAERYMGQIAAYVSAVGAATGKPTTGLLLWV